MKTVYLLFVVLTSALMLTACKMKTEELTGEIKVMVPFGGNHTTHMQVIKRMFQDKYPRVNVILETEREDSMTERISSGDVPDILIGDYGYLPMKYVKEKLILDLKKLPGSAELFDRIAPQYIFEYLGGRYFVPWYATTQLMIYNKVLFKEAGLDPEKPPKTFDQYLEYAKKIDSLPARADSSKVYGNYLWNELLAYNGYYWKLISPIYYNFNGAKYGLLNETGTQIIFDKPESKMVDFLKFMNEAQKYAPVSSTNNDFFRRDKGMWMQFGYDTRRNTTLSNAKDGAMVIGKDVGFASMPTLKEGDPSWSTLDGKTLMIFKSNPSRENLAWEFIKYLMQDDIQLLTVKSFEQFPTLKSIESNPYFQTPDTKPFIDQLKNVKPNEAVAELNGVSKILLEKYTRFVINHELTAESAVRQAAEEARAKLNK